MSSFYGDGMRWWHGVVEEIGTDRPQLGKVKVRIRGIHDNATELSTDDLPYAQCLIPTTEAGTSGFGANPNLMVGAHVVGFFLDGAMSQLPVIFGSLPKIEIPSLEQCQLNPDLSFNSRSMSSAYLYDAAYYRQGDSYLQRAWDFFRSHNFPAISVAAMLGNFMHECGGKDDLIPAVKADDKNKKAHGIAQWRQEDRVKDLKALAKKRKKTWEDFDTQLNFVIWELKEHNNQHDPIDFQSVTDIAAATVFFQHKYEICAYEGGATKADLNAISDFAPEEEKEKRYSAYTIYGKKVFERIGEKERIAFARKIYAQFTQTEQMRA